MIPTRKPCGCRLVMHDGDMSIYSQRDCDGTCDPDGQAAQWDRVDDILSGEPPVNTYREDNE